MEVGFLYAAYFTPGEFKQIKGISPKKLKPFANRKTKSGQNNSKR